MYTHLLSGLFEHKECLICMAYCDQHFNCNHLSVENQHDTFFSIHSYTSVDFSISPCKNQRQQSMEVRVAFRQLYQPHPNHNHNSLTYHWDLIKQTLSKRTNNSIHGLVVAILNNLTCNNVLHNLLHILKENTMAVAF